MVLFSFDRLLRLGRVFSKQTLCYTHGHIQPHCKYDLKFDTIRKEGGFILSRV
ncbi:hypothetical protein C2G38_2117332 [Gigaspora rosea]|uniref:Uncharacterized protein n=1 Tax=Gigaspora rosea TaxID=44941 RepID=A0A397UA17_9GLOM|nr:hypothetical protein C2G38_2117332 [Gigaspora rosea]